MNDKEICFIICSNNQLYTEECIYYINHLSIPEGYQIDILTVKDAKSMTAGYNEAMRYSKAKYKVYLHQDTFIVNANFIQDILDIFQSDEQIGMIGNIGAVRMPDSGIMWETERYGMLYEQHIYETELGSNPVKGRKYLEVEAIDGFLMITQYDITWREDLFNHWDFYDCSQSMEFIRKGYKVVVPAMKKPWCVHDYGFLNLESYEEERLKFLKEYNISENSRKRAAMEKEKVSIIIPTYNRAYCIERSIRSVLAQTYQEFELIVVDDGSSDNTQDVVNSIGDGRVRYIPMPENKGVAAARNEGVRQAAYEYIAFQDSDDVWKPDKLEKQMQALRENPQAGMVYCAYEWHEEDGSSGITPDEGMPLRDKRGDIYIKLLCRNTIGAPTVLARKECFMKAGLFCENMTCLEDWEFFLRIAKTHEILFLEEPLVVVYMRDNGVSSNVAGYFEARCYMIAQHREALLQSGLFNKVVEDVLLIAKEAGVLEAVNKMLQIYLQ